MSKQPDQVRPKQETPQQWWGVWIEGHGWYSSGGMVFYAPTRSIAQAMCDVLKNPDATPKEF